MLHHRRMIHCLLHLRTGTWLHSCRHGAVSDRVRRMIHRNHRRTWNAVVHTDGRRLMAVTAICSSTATRMSTGVDSYKREGATDHCFFTKREVTAMEFST